jgi:hypothetical protein
VGSHRHCETVTRRAVYLAGLVCPLRGCAMTSDVIGQLQTAAGGDARATMDDLRTQQGVMQELQWMTQEHRVKLRTGIRHFVST